jgi:homoserine kinase type II
VALRRLAGKQAVIVTFLKGLWPRQIEPFHCVGVGEALARFHLSGADFALTRQNDLSLAGWRRLADSIGERAEEVTPGLALEIAGEIAALEARFPSDLPTGVCHADLFPDNVFFQDETVSGVIDFYFACTDALAYDLAICLNAWCFDREHRFQPERARGMIAAYERLRPLSVAEREALPLLARGSALRFLLTRLYDWLNRSPGALVEPKDPREYLAKLRFHRTLDGPGAYLG